MIGDSKQVIEGSIGWFLTRNYELRHVEAIHGEVDQGVLLGVVASEALKIHYQYWWHVVHLYLLDSLLVVDTAIAVPCILMRQLLWPIELSKAIVDTDTLGQLFTTFNLVLTIALILRVIVMDESIEARVQRPALLVIKLNEQLKLEILTLLRLS